MSSITLFYNNFAVEEELEKELVAATGYTLLTDRKLLALLAERFAVEQKKAERAIFGQKSVFNAFTLEKERTFSQLKLIVAERIMADNVIICGFAALLIPPDIGHILRVGVFDEKKGRMQRALAGGVTERKAAKMIANHDKKARGFEQMYHLDSVHRPSLYDIRINAHTMSVRKMVQSILEQYRRPALLPSAASQTAANNFLLTAKVEQALTARGYAVKALCKKEEITIKVNQSSFNFTALADKIRTIVSEIDNMKEIRVIASADMAYSIISDQEFTPPPKVLLVDDEQEFVQTLSERLITRQYGSHPVFDGEQALACLETETPDVMVLDLKMPGIQGIEVLTEVKKAHSEIEVIILTGHGSESDRATCMEQGAFAYLQKPVDIKELTAVIDKAYAKVAAERLEKIQ